MPRGQQSDIQNDLFDGAVCLTQQSGGIFETHLCLEPADGCPGTLFELLDDCRYRVGIKIINFLYTER